MNCECQEVWTLPTDGWMVCGKQQGERNFSRIDRGMLRARNRQYNVTIMARGCSGLAQMSQIRACSRSQTSASNTDSAVARPTENVADSIAAAALISFVALERTRHAECVANLTSSRLHDLKQELRREGHASNAYAREVAGTWAAKSSSTS